MRIGANTIRSTLNIMAAKTKPNSLAGRILNSPRVSHYCERIPETTLHNISAVRQYRIDKGFSADEEIHKILTRINKDCKLGVFYNPQREVSKIAEHFDTLSPEMKICVSEMLRNIKFKKNGNLTLKSKNILENARILASIEPEVNGIYRAGDSTVETVLRETKTRKNVIRDQFNHETPAYDNNLRFNSLKQYLQNNNKKNPELCNEFYEKYYLANVAPHTAGQLREIHNKFGVKTFLMDHEGLALYTDQAQAEYIYRELSEYIRASNGKAKLPKVLDLNKFGYKKFLTGKSTGVADIWDQNIAIKNNLDNILRHEIMHLNHHCGLTSRITTLPIIKLFKTLNIYKKPLSQAGISDFHINYAYTDIMELVAVAAQGDMQSYSKNAKRLFRMLGMPEWAFNLRKDLPPRANAAPDTAQSWDKDFLIKIMN